MLCEGDAAIVGLATVAAAALADGGVWLVVSLYPPPLVEALLALRPVTTCAVFLHACPVDGAVFTVDSR